MPPKKDKADNTAMRELKRAIKEGAPKKLYLFHGEEAFLRDYYLGQLKQALLPAGLEEFNLHAAQGKDCSVDWIEQAADCLPMMSGRTLVIVTDFDLYGLGEKPRERLVKVLEELPDYCCMVFVYDLLPYKADGRSKLAGLLKREGAVVDFQRQSQGDLTDWICRQFKKAGKGVDTEDARYLIFLCGDLMNTLSAEIGKIAAYSPQPRVTREDMDAVAIPQIDAVVFQMTDAMARKDFDKAASVLADLLHSQQPPIMILAAMGKYFRQLYTARLYLDRGKGRGEFMELWGMKSGYQADKLMDAARRFSLPWCRYAVGRCAQADIELKSSYGQERELLTGLLMELASGRRAAVTFSLNKNLTRFILGTRKPVCGRFLGGHRAAFYLGDYYENSRSYCSRRPVRQGRSGGGGRHPDFGDGGLRSVQGRRAAGASAQAGRTAGADCAH